MSDFIQRDPEKDARKNRVTRRFDINVGFRCNLRCKFCYYLKDIENNRTCDLSTQEIKRRLRLGRSWDKVRVDLTGGEPTLRPDLPELIAYAREIGYETVCIITNGLEIARRDDLLPRLHEAGLNDLLLSLHGDTAATHDEAVQREGAFEAVQETARRVEATEDLPLRFNYVVCQANYHETAAAVERMASFAPMAVNLILFHPTRDAQAAEGSVQFENYRDVANLVKDAIDRIQDRVPHINVRDIPYCLLKGYERHVKPLYQLQYETVEWDYCLDVTLKKGRLFAWAATLFGGLLSLANPYFWRANGENRRRLCLQRARIYQMRRKGPACATCAVRHICDGLSRPYVDQYGAQELAPYGGDLIMNPTYFMPDDELEPPLQ